MAQPSIVNYFHTRKRCAADEANIARAKKVLILDDKPSESLKGRSQESLSPDLNKNVYSKFLSVKTPRDIDGSITDRPKVVTKLNFNILPPKPKPLKKAPAKVRRKLKDDPLQGSIDKLLNKIPQKAQPVIRNEIVHKTPPTTPTKAPVNAMDKVVLTGNELSLNELKQKMSRSARLAELKASISKFKQADEKLKEIEKETSAIPYGGSSSPSLQSFKTIELEIVSPQKSPTKAYLSPKKPADAARKNLLGFLSPSKSKETTSSIFPKSPAKQPSALSLEKSSLTLPYKYRSLAEMFRSIDVVAQILHNRKETITFQKLKPAVEEMIRKNLTETHLQQIKYLYPEAYNFKREKMRVFGMPGKTEQWELILAPILSVDPTTGTTEEPHMTSQCLIKRQQRFYSVLISKLKSFHEEFLLSLNPPLCIPKEKITRWHPEFDIENVPDIDKADLPPVPDEEILTTGKEVLEKARSLFSCNTRMERALEKLKEMQETKQQTEATEEAPKEELPSSLLKGIPKSLLEKVRAKQAAKALETMTRSAGQEKEITMYSRFPELARLTRNTFVVEKKAVLQIDFLLNKLSNSFRSYLTNYELEQHLRTLASCVPGWMVFHEIRGTVFVKLSKNADLNLILRKLEKLLEEKKKM